MAGYEYRSEASIVNSDREIRATDIPNGVVVRGPGGKPILVDYDDDGKMVNSGTEVEIGDWLSGIGKSIPEDMVILVHSVKGDGQMLLKSLEVNRILRNGKKMSVAQAAKEGVLPKFVETLREKFVKTLEKKGSKCVSTADSTAG